MSYQRCFFNKLFTIATNTSIPFYRYLRSFTTRTEKALHLSII